MRGLFLGLSTIALLSSSSFALHFTTESECAALCSDGSNSTTSNFKTSTTNSTDVVCEDNEYSGSGNGIRFKNCLNCLQKSDATWKEQSDVYWFLCKSQYVTGSGLANMVMVQTTCDMRLMFAYTLTQMRQTRVLLIPLATLKAHAALSRML